MELTPKSFSGVVLFLVLLDSYLQYFYPGSFPALTYPLNSLNARDDIAGTLRSDTIRMFPSAPIVDLAQRNDNITISHPLPDNLPLVLPSDQAFQEQNRNSSTNSELEDNANNARELEEIEQEEDNHAADDQIQILRTQTLLAQRQINDFNIPSFNSFLIAATRWLSSQGRWWGIGWAIQRGLKIILKFVLWFLFAVLVIYLSKKG